MFPEECVCCQNLQEEFTCAWCEGYICENCEMNETRTCEGCGEYGLCPTCVEPAAHGCSSLDETEAKFDGVDE